MTRLSLSRDRLCSLFGPRRAFVQVAESFPSERHTLFRWVLLLLLASAFFRAVDGDMEIIGLRPEEWFGEERNSWVHWGLM